MISSIRHVNVYTIDHYVLCDVHVLSLFIQSDGASYLQIYLHSSLEGAIARNEARAHSARIHNTTNPSSPPSLCDTLLNQLLATYDSQSADHSDNISPTLYSETDAKCITTRAGSESTSAAEVESETDASLLAYDQVSEQTIRKMDAVIQPPDKSLFWEKFSITVEVDAKPSKCSVCPCCQHTEETSSPMNISSLSPLSTLCSLPSPLPFLLPCYPAIWHSICHAIDCARPPPPPEDPQIRRRKQVSTHMNRTKASQQRGD